MQVNVGALQLQISGRLLLEARAVLAAAPERSAATVADEVGLCLLLAALDPVGAALLADLGGLGRIAAGQALERLSARVAPAVLLRTARALCAEVMAPSMPAEAPPPSVPTRERGHWSGLPDPYPGLTLDTGAGPETWLDFAARTRNGTGEHAPALERWTRAAAAWERAQEG